MPTKLIKGVFADEREDISGEGERRRRIHFENIFLKFCSRGNLKRLGFKRLGFKKLGFNRLGFKKVFKEADLPM